LSEVVVFFVNKSSLGWLDRAGDHNLFANHEVLREVVRLFDLRF
jgi:hypothetical protein